MPDYSLITLSLATLSLTTLSSAPEYPPQYPPERRDGICRSGANVPGVNVTLGTQWGNRYTEMHRGGQKRGMAWDSIALVKM